MASYVYLPKVRDRVVVEAALRDAISKLDAPFGYAESIDAASGAYRGLIYAKTAPAMLGPDALLVSKTAALAQLAATEPDSGSGKPRTMSADAPAEPGDAIRERVGERGAQKPRRFFGAVDLDLSRPVKNFDTIVREVVDQLARTEGVKLRLTLEISADAPAGFDEGDISVVRDNVRQLKFDPASTGFSE
jgi:hypothetical protein